MSLRARLAACLAAFARWDYGTAKPEPWDSVAIFGAGGAAEQAYRRLKPASRIVAFLDNDPKKQGRHLFGIPIHDPRAFDYASVKRVVIASQWSADMRNQLIEQGLHPELVEILDPQR